MSEPRLRVRFGCVGMNDQLEDLADFPDTLEEAEEMGREHAIDSTGFEYAIYALTPDGKEIPIEQYFTELGIPKRMCESCGNTHQASLMEVYNDEDPPRVVAYACVSGTRCSELLSARVARKPSSPESHTSHSPEGAGQ